MIPFSDGVRVQRFPLVNAALIAANFAVFVFYELPDLNAAISHASFYPCSIENACSTQEPWGVGWLTAMFLHAGWGHLLGNMWFLAIFGKNVEDALGRLSYLIFYLAGGFVATIVQTDMTLVSTASHTGPALGASGAIAAVLGAYFVLLSQPTRVHAAAVDPGQDPGVVVPRFLISADSSSVCSWRQLSSALDESRCRRRDGEEFAFPLGVAHAVNTIPHQAQHQCGYHYGRQQN